MAKRFKDFGSPAVDDSEPIEFALHGESFTAHPQVQGAVLLDLVQNSSEDDPAKAAASINNFLEHVLEPESLERFKALQRDPKRIVSMELLGEIVGWLTEEYTNRPE